MAARVTKLEAGAGALADYYDWFKDAREGDVVVYHRGDLQFDRDPANVPSTAVWAEDARTVAEATNALALRILKDAAEGYLVLSQKRMGESDYEYRAVRIRTALEKHFSAPRVKDGPLVSA